MHKKDDDTVIPGKQAAEDASMALFKAGAHPALAGTPVEHFHLTDDASVQATVDRVSELDEKALCFFELKREAVKVGPRAGRLAAETIQKLPENVWGDVVLSFSGYAGDSRELWEIPESIRFCRGMLLGNPKRPDLDHAKRTLAVLMDERPYINLETLEAEDLFIHAAGGLWLVRVAFPNECWFSRGGRMMLDPRMNVAIYNWLIGEGDPPA